ncbi:hypothetical protein BM526_20060 (plasmid) [Alteromonas mediterranea]|uniref:GspE/PulE family protein n=1 Tax=Alteromonas mediterranea TaxID=314275 RepID=UPI000903B0B5|nr:ATPase, T2SS/T4P/T4SS family [Alteromonas mediterranea]APE04268.1 hypothetical protein BM526_20060 [Alteromonas mediterranea]
MNESNPIIEDNDLTFEEVETTSLDEQGVGVELLKSVDDYLQQGYYAHQAVVGHCLSFAEDNEGFYCLMLVSDDNSKTPILATTEATLKDKRSDLQFIRSLSSSFGLKPPVIKVVDEESVVSEISALKVAEIADGSEVDTVDTDLSDAKRMFNEIIVEGIVNGASDVDICYFPRASYYAFAVGGKMTPRKPLSQENAKLMINAMFNTESENMTSSLEDEQIIFNNLNVVVTVPKQDGGSNSENVRLRAEKTYAHNGYTLSIRIIRTGQSDDFSLEQLGFEPSQLEALRYLLKTPTGIILIVGPTGHGKSVTLKALYEEMDKEWKIVVIEDPVEYIINHPNVTQRPVVDDKGLTIKRHLKSTLRQFPKVIGISEIRDLEVAEDVINISLSGHKMVSTMHANDALAVLTRLNALGVSYQIQAQENLFSATLSQRLLPKLCQHCKLPDKHPTYGDIFKKNPKGCDQCKKKGLKGVELAAEIVIFDSEVRNLLDKNRFNEVRPYLKSKGWMSIKDVGILKVKRGLVDPEEMFKALGDENNNDTAEFNYQTGSFEQKSS